MNHYDKISIRKRIFCRVLPYNNNFKQDKIQLAFCSLRSPILANYILPLKWALGLQGSLLKSSKIKLYSVILSTTLLVGYYISMYFLPDYLAEISQLEKIYDNGTTSIDSIISNNSTKQNFTRDEVVFLLNKFKEIEASNKSLLYKLIDVYHSFSKVLLALLLFHVVTLYSFWAQSKPNKKINKDT